MFYILFSWKNIIIFKSQYGYKVLQSVYSLPVFSTCYVEGNKYLTFYLLNCVCFSSADFTKNK